MDWFLQCRVQGCITETFPICVSLSASWEEKSENPVEGIYGVASPISLNPSTASLNESKATLSLCQAKILPLLLQKPVTQFAKKRAVWLGKTFVKGNFNRNVVLL